MSGFLSGVFGSIAAFFGILLSSPGGSNYNDSGHGSDYGSGSSRTGSSSDSSHAKMSYTFSEGNQVERSSHIIGPDTVNIGDKSYDVKEVHADGSIRVNDGGFFGGNDKIVESDGTVRDPGWWE